MESSENWSAKSLPTRKNKLAVVWLIIIVSFLGFLNAGYLAVKHYTKTPIVCSIFENCDKVTTSPYAVIFNLPVSLFGALFYLAVFLLALYYLQSRNQRAVNLIFILSAAAFLVSVYFVYLQIFVLKALCFYCLLSALSSLLLFIFSLYLFLNRRFLFF